MIGGERKASTRKMPYFMPLNTSRERIKIEIQDASEAEADESSISGTNLSIAVMLLPCPLAKERRESVNPRTSSSIMWVYTPSDLMTENRK